ncbi:MAG: hypothetical protein JNL39_14145 [Opitutaceae bacterium]|nr:hypothetical protein [Opitutaceae bacterium]
MSYLPRLASFTLLTSAWLGAAPAIPKGQVLAQVACVADQSQTYALYIPTTFDPAKKSPVLFCFDPGARGRNPVERFKEAAEKFGWIVAGSNNSRNGPWDANAAAIKAMVGDVTRHLPVDGKRIYVAGLSGGARVACTVAASGMAQGVIACSAGFGGSETPARVPFAFFGTAGVTDFNYRELRRVDRELADRKATHRVVIFDGGHEWLPSTLAIEALGWLELHAMRTGARAKDAAWIAAQFAARTAVVPEQPAVETWRALRSLAADFKGLADTAPIEQRAKELAARRDVRDALKAEEKAEAREEDTVVSLLSAADDGRVAALKKTVADLQAKAQGADATERQRATRILQGVASSCGEMAREATRAGEHERAAGLLELSAMLRPDRARTLVELARARAQTGERKAALEALERAVAAGYRDAEALAQDKAFDRIRREPGFAVALEKMKAAGAVSSPDSRRPGR